MGLYFDAILVQLQAIAVNRRSFFVIIVLYFHFFNWAQLLNYVKKCNASICETSNAKKKAINLTKRTNANGPR